MGTTQIEGLPAGLSVEPCTCGCAHKTLAELLSDTCECGCDCHSKERIAQLEADAARAGVDLDRIVKTGAVS